MELKKPYYAVIFTNIRTKGDLGYAQMADDMEQLAKEQKGYLGLESARSGLGITVSYWQTLEAIAAWKANIDHLQAQKKRKSDWYSWYKIRFCKVAHEYEFTAD